MLLYSVEFTPLLHTLHILEAVRIASHYSLFQAWTGMCWFNSSALDNMAAISQRTFSNASPWMKSFVSWFKFHLNLFLTFPIDNKWALVQVMAWRRIGDKPLHEPMLTQFTDTYMRHKGEMSYGDCFTNLHRGFPGTLGPMVHVHVGLSVQIADTLSHTQPDN